MKSCNPFSNLQETKIRQNHNLTMMLMLCDDVDDGLKSSYRVPAVIQTSASYDSVGDQMATSTAIILSAAPSLG
jgi:hypothetical protein